jgi:hypothetical protein
MELVTMQFSPALRYTLLTSAILLRALLLQLTRSLVATLCVNTSQSTSIVFLPLHT